MIYIIYIMLSMNIKLRNSPEKEVVQVIIGFLKNMGFKVYFNDLNVDVLGVKIDTHTHIICPVECKVRLDDKAIGQCLRYLTSFDLPIINLAYRSGVEKFFERMIKRFDLPINLVCVSDGKVNGKLLAFREDSSPDYLSWYREEV